MKLSTAPTTSGTQRWARVAAAFAAVGVFVFVPIPLCPLRIAFHIPCPGCGLTRGLLCALSGEFTQSLRYHPLAGPAATLVMLSVPFFVRGIMTHGTVQSLPRGLQMAWGAFLIFSVAVWILRFAGALGGPAPI